MLDVLDFRLAISRNLTAIVGKRPGRIDNMEELPVMRTNNTCRHSPECFGNVRVLFQTTQVYLQGSAIYILFLLTKTMSSCL